MQRCNCFDPLRTVSSLGKLICMHAILLNITDHNWDEQWLGKIMPLCVIIIKQVSRGTAGEENGVRRVRGKKPGRGSESEKCRQGWGEGGGGGNSGLVLSASWEAYVIVCHHHQPGAERDDGRGEWL